MAGSRASGGRSAPRAPAAAAQAPAQWGGSAPARPRSAARGRGRGGAEAPDRSATATAHEIRTTSAVQSSHAPERERARTGGSPPASRLPEGSPAT
jgi:hypothetical protein